MKIGYDVCINQTRYTGFFEERFLRVELKENIWVALVLEKDKTTGVRKSRLAVENKSEKDIEISYTHLRYILNVPHAHLSYFTSEWGSEYSPVEVDVTYPIRIGTWSGRSSKGCSPYFHVGSVQGDGDLAGFSVGWSGNWEATVEHSGGENIITVGLLKDDFYTTVKPGDIFENIEIFDAKTENGNREELAAKFRTYYRDNISFMSERFDTLPVCYNSWWPYEDKLINEDVFYENTKIAKSLGFTNTLLDAGWFGPAGNPAEMGASAWSDKQGDWDLINTALFPSGIKKLGMRINQEIGIPFGIWCEIEAVGKDSHLFETNPELIAMKNGRPLDYLCMGNPKTQEWAIGIFETLIEEYGAKWVKIDFNRDPIACDCEEHGHGKGDGLYEHYKGLYGFMDKIREKYPHVVLENCSSGGLRLDYGIMQHCHLAFLSDPDYTPHHLKCFWGALSHIHPCGCYHFTKSEIIGDHNPHWDNYGNRISERIPITEKTTVERLDYMTRACMMSSIGFSLKLTELPKWALLRIKQHVKIFKEIAKEYIYKGDVYRLSDQPLHTPELGPKWSGFEFINADKNAIFFVFKKSGGVKEVNLQLQGLLTDSLYEISPYEGGKKELKTGYELMQDGFTVYAQSEEWSQLYSVKQVFE